MRDKNGWPSWPATIVLIVGSLTGLVWEIRLGYRVMRRH